MSDLLKAAKDLEKSKKKGYTLTEIVGILTLIQEGMKVSDIALLTGRSRHSLRYKFLEQNPIKGQSKPRSIHQYESMSDLFASHGETYSEEVLAQKIEEFKMLVAKKAEG